MLYVERLFESLQPLYSQPWFPYALGVMGGAVRVFGLQDLEQAAQVGHVSDHRRHLRHHLHELGLLSQ